MRDEAVTIRTDLGCDSDFVTGFTGTARTETIHGNVSVCLERADDNGKPEEVWLPERRLRLSNGYQKKVGI